MLEVRQGDLSGIGFGLFDLTGWNFAGRNLTDANFGGTTVTGADFTGANLTDADFFDADLTGADLRGAIGGVRGAVTQNMVRRSGDVYGLKPDALVAAVPEPSSLLLLAVGLLALAFRRCRVGTASNTSCSRIKGHRSGIVSSVSIA